MKLFGRKLKGESKYFKSRQADEKTGAVEQEVKPAKQKISSAMPVAGGVELICDRLINRDLLTKLFREMRNHDADASVVLLANTIDNATRQPGIMINKGRMPKRIVGYLQNIGMSHIEEALRMVKTRDLDDLGFYPADERTAANLNLPLGCMLLGITHHLKRDFGVVLVLKTGMKDKKGFVGKIRKIIKT